MNRVLPILVVGVGGFIGTVLRYLLSLAGATAWRGILAYGPNSRIRTAKILDLSSDMPIVTEITDEEAKINSFLSTLHDLFEAARCGGLVTVERVQVIKYLHGKI